MSYIYWLSQIQHSEKSLVGEKLFILSQLLQHECSILPGFILGHNLSKQFLAGLDLKKLSTSNLSDFVVHSDQDFSKDLQSVADRTLKVIDRAKFPQEWSTQVNRAAQQLNSNSLILQPFLTIPYQQQSASQNLWRSHTCNNNDQAITIALKKVVSELFTASSLLYWYKLGLSIEDIDLAILVRPLHSTYASGIIELTDNIVTIKASWGLEQSLLQGEVEPDEYYVNKSTGYIVSRHLGYKNYAYQPKNKDLNIASENCLAAYIPNETHSETYVLDRLAIAKLIQLTQVILEQQPQIKYLVWTAPEIKDRSLPNFYFTQLSNYLPSTSTLLTRESTSNELLSAEMPSLLQGIAAAPGNIVAKTVIIEDFKTHHGAIPPDCILVAKTIPPHQIHLIKQVKGIITETGGITSHGAIIARELNIPAIVNAVDATKILHHGTEVLLNGDEGKVYSSAAHPSPLNHLFHRLVDRRMLSAISPASRKASGERVSRLGMDDFSYPLATRLMINLSQSESISKTRNLPVDGIGLLRSELMLAELLTPQFLMQRQETVFRLRFLNTLTDSLRQFVTAFAPRPVFYRSIDLYAGNTPSSILGDRGTYSYLSDPTIFHLELEALAKLAAEGHSNFNLILPFVRSVEEFEFCYRAIEKFGLTTRKSFQVWIMAEVPSVIFLLPEYIRAGVNGIAIGTNDLTQLLFGVDREQAEFSDRGLNANHPAMHKAIAELITTAKANNIECCLCGQAPVQYPELIDKLIAWGLDTISVEPEAVARTYKAIARAERRILLRDELNKSS